MLAPTTLYIEVNRRCNLRCEHCDFWKTNDRTSLPTERIRSLIAEFAEMGGKTVVTCGGEASLDSEDFWALHGAARANGLASFSVTNGTKVTRMTAGRWISQGPSEITVSIDHPDEDEHDRMRGVQGSWLRACEAVGMLVQERERLGATTKIFVMTIVAERNYRDLPLMFEMAAILGADKLKLNIAQPTFGHPQQDQWFADNVVKDPDDLMRVIAACDARWGISRNPVWKADVHAYLTAVNRNKDAAKGWHSDGQMDRQICNSGERNIWVSHKGTARLCPSAHFPGRTVLHAGSLKPFWEAATWRTELSTCKRYCGISHSVRRSSSTIPLYPPGDTSGSMGT